MISMGIKVTPTFKLFRGNSNVATTTGVNENNLKEAVMAHLMPHEAGWQPQLPAEASESNLSSNIIPLKNQENAALH